MHNASIPYLMAHQRDHQSDARPTPELDEAYWNGNEWLYGIESAETDLTREQAEQIAREAIMDTYDLSESDMADADFFDAHLIEGSDGKHFWDIRTYVNVDGVDLNLYVTLDAQTEEILRMGLETGGNG